MVLEYREYFEYMPRSDIVESYGNSIWLKVLDMLTHVTTTIMHEVHLYYCLHFTDDYVGPL